MKCWCDEIDYKCSECETKRDWKDLTPTKQIKLLSYQKILMGEGMDQKNSSHIQLSRYLIDNDLCVSMIPVL